MSRRPAASETGLMGNQRILGAIGVALSLVAASSSHSKAATGEICQMVAGLIDHPAQYASEKIQQCARNFWGVLNPTCCAPGWELNPSCYVVNQKLVKDAWQEAVEVEKCNTYEVLNSIDNFLAAYYDPDTFLLKQADPLIAVAKAALSATNLVAKSLPGDVKAELYRQIDSKAITAYDQKAVDRARWTTNANDLAKLYHPTTYGADHDAITFGDVIIMDKSIGSRAFCEKVSLFAHEVMHVAQYADLGMDRFMAEYLTETLEGTRYEDLSAEREGYDVERRSLAACKNGYYQSEIAKIERGASYRMADMGDGYLVKIYDPIDGTRHAELRWCHARELVPEACSEAYRKRDE